MATAVETGDVRTEELDLSRFQALQRLGSTAAKLEVEINVIRQAMAELRPEAVVAPEGYAIRFTPDREDYFRMQMKDFTDEDVWDRILPDDPAYESQINRTGKTGYYEGHFLAGSVECDKDGITWAYSLNRAFRVQYIDSMAVSPDFVTIV